MRTLKYYTAFLTIIFLSSCVGISKQDPSRSEGVKMEGHARRVRGFAIEPIQYDQNDVYWKQKSEVDRLLPELAGETWEKRDAAQEKILKLILDSDISVMEYFALRSTKHSDPEISFRSKNILKFYFRKTLYDPDQKKGFIGLQLTENGRIVIKGKQYSPIKVDMPQEGFPGKAAGILAGDLILGV